MSCDIGLEQCTIKPVSCIVGLVQQCTVKAVSCDVLLTSDSLVGLEQYESIWYLVGRLGMPQKSPP